MKYRPNWCLHGETRWCLTDSHQWSPLVPSIRSAVFCRILNLLDNFYPFRFKIHTDSGGGGRGGWTADQTQTWQLLALWRKYYVCSWVVVIVLMPLLFLNYSHSREVDIHSDLGILASCRYRAFSLFCILSFLFVSTPPPDRPSVLFYFYCWNCAVRPHTSAFGW